MTTLHSQLRLTLFDQVSGRMRGIHREVAAFQGRVRAMAVPFSGFTARIAAVGAGYIGVTAGMRGTVGAALKFENAFADVVKVLDASPGQLQEVRHQIVELSKQLPNSAEGIAAIYAQAAQSNIPLKELGKFSEMVAKVAVAWDTSEGDTSDALAKIKNQLNLSVGEIGLFADAINHLGNNTAAKAPDLVDFSKRVAATGEMFGFTATQTLAFGGAMVASGAQTEVASTSFRNMGRALTIGARATKQNEIAFRKLGLNAVSTAKNMQENALDTTLDVLDRIGRLPEWERISIASALFGDEARALMPVIANSTELRRQLGLVGSEANYAGSAVEEYMTRADTVGNQLAITGNKIRAVFRGWGEGMLPSIKGLNDGLGDVFDTLHTRIGIFDQVKAGFDGLMVGLGYGGPAGLRTMVNDLGDILFGKAFDGGGFMQATDERAKQLARISNSFRQIGRDVRQFASDVADNPITKFMGEIAGQGFKLFLASTGIALLAGAVTKLAKAMFVLSGAGAAVAIIKSLAGIGKSIFGKLPKTPVPVSRTNGVAPSGAGPQTRGGRTGYRSPWPANGGDVQRGGPTGPHRPQMTMKPSLPKPNWTGALKGFFGKGGLFGIAANYVGETAISAGLEQLNRNLYSEETRSAAERKLRTGGIWSKEWWLGDAADPDFSLRDRLAINAGISGGRRRSQSEEAGGGVGVFQQFLSGIDKLLQSSEQQVPTLRSIHDVLSAPPRGTQDVRITNPQPVLAPVNVTVYATTNASADEIGRQTADRVRGAVEGAYNDGGM